MKQDHSFGKEKKCIDQDTEEIYCQNKNYSKWF